MGASLMDGVAVSNALLETTALRAAAFAAGRGRKPCLATLLIGDDPASATYVEMKRRRCLVTGLDSQRHTLPASTTTTEAAVGLVRDLSLDPTVDGILVQHPVPSQVDERAVFEAIAPGKDVDGVTTASFAAMALGLPGFHSCTPAGIMRLLDAYDVPLQGAHAVVIGRSDILGRPVGMLLLQRDATVTYCHSRTRGLPDIVATADLVVAAVGRANLIEGSWIRAGAVVVDAGYNADNVGDVAFVGAAQRARLITPVPGGVGPMTIATLLAQTVDAAQARTTTA